MKNKIFLDPATTWVSGDYHLNHGNSYGEPQRGILKHQGRAFPSVEAMDKVLIEKTNERIRPNDTFIFCGDFCWWDRVRDRKKNISLETLACEYRKKINCRKIYFIWGNHDVKLRTSQAFRNLFSGCYDLLLATIGLDEVVFTHPAPKVWYGSRRGSISVYGHSHGRLFDGLSQREQDQTTRMRNKFKDDDLKLFDDLVNRAMPTRQMDCGIDTRNDLAPYHWSEILDYVNKKPYKTPDAILEKSS